MNMRTAGHQWPTPSPSWMQPVSGRPSSSHPQWAARLPSILPSDTLTHAQLVWLDDVAHLPQLESDPTTLEEIAKFVEAQRAGYRNSPTGMSHQ
jgi:hypothetical protein